MNFWKGHKKKSGSTYQNGIYQHNQKGQVASNLDSKYTHNMSILSWIYNSLGKSCFWEHA